MTDVGRLRNLLDERVPRVVSLDLDDTDRAVAAADDAGVALQVGFNRRFDPGHAAVAQGFDDQAGVGRAAPAQAGDRVEQGFLNRNGNAD